MDQKIKIPKILFVADKWCAGDKNFGLSAWEGNLISSLRSVGLSEVETFHFDEYFDTYQERGDRAFLKKIGEWKPDMIVAVVYNMPGSKVNTPEWSTFDKIKDEFHLPILAIWGDLEIKEQVEISEVLLPYVTLNAATASSAAISRLRYPEKYIYMWVPKDPALFRDGSLKRDIDVGYVGSPKNDRLRAINYMIRHGINVVHTGGERQAHLSTEDFVKMYQRSKIALSFSRAVYSQVVNARPFEAMTCGAMLLEEESFELPKLYVPFVDYIPYKNKRDLVKKAKYYLAHHSEREAIALSAFRKTTEQYSAERFWCLLIDKVLKRPSSDAWPSNLPLLKASDLSRLPPLRSLKFRFLDRLCSTSLGFDLYLFFVKIFDWRFWRGLFIKISKMILRNILPAATYGSILKKGAKYIKL